MFASDVTATAIISRPSSVVPIEKDLHARAGLLEHAHVLVDLFGVRQPAGRAGDVAEHGLRRRHVFDAGR